MFDGNNDGDSASKDSLVDLRKAICKNGSWRTITVCPLRRRGSASVSSLCRCTWGHGAISKRMKTYTPPPPPAAPPKKPPPISPPKVEPEPRPPVRPRPPAPSKIAQLTKRFEQLEQRQVGFLLSPKDRQWLDLRGHLEPHEQDQITALTILESALKRNVEAGTTRFKPRDLKDTQEVLGEELFRWAWRQYLKLGVIVLDKTSTAGRYIYQPLED